VITVAAKIPAKAIFLINVDFILGFNV